MPRSGPDLMRDRWKTRPVLADDKATLYWHVLFGSDPDACAAARSVQARIANLPGLHLTPLTWLHMTVMVVGSSDQALPSVFDNLAEAARQRLTGVEAVPVTLGTVAHHPEAIALLVRPARALRPIREAIIDATSEVVGDIDVERKSDVWIPHVTVAYSTREQSAIPIAAALRDAADDCATSVNTISLVAQWGAERDWKWQITDSIRLEPSRG